MRLRPLIALLLLVRLRLVVSIAKVRGLAGNPSAAVLSGCAYFVALYGCRVNFTGAELAAVADRRLFPGAEHLHLLLTDPGARHTSRLSLDGAVNDSATG